MTKPKASLTYDMASFGADWTEPSGTRFQLVSLRGTYSVRLYVQSQTAPWHSVRVDDPERFGPLPIKDARTWRAYVNAWFAAAEEGDDDE